MAMNEPVLELNQLGIDLVTANSAVSVVKDVTLRLGQGEVLGLIGESGCGKSLTCMAVLGLLDQGQWRVSGDVKLKEADILGVNKEALRILRGREMAMIMQNPVQAFDPLFTIGSHFRETIGSHQKMNRKESRDMAVNMLLWVGLKDPLRVLDRYPFQCSGGMLQRVMIALALVMRPAVMVADEPTTSLDLTIQYQILGRLEELRSRYCTGILLVSHDLGVVGLMADEIAVMYNGCIVEKPRRRNCSKTRCIPIPGL
jgi:nickel transport system ATP-binding protein